MVGKGKLTIFESSNISKTGQAMPTKIGVKKNSDDSQFWISMGGYDCGYLYKCSLNGVDDNNNSPYEPPHSVPIPSVSSGEIPLHAVKFK